MRYLMGLLLLAKYGFGSDLSWTPANPNTQPPKSTLIFTEDFSTKFVGTYITQKSWTAGRQSPTIETCAVACVTKCATKRATKCALLKSPVADTSECNAIMYVRATGECHMGRGVSLPTSEEEPTEFVYMIPGSGSWQSLYSHPEEHQLTKGSLLTTLPTLKRQWRVTFQLKATRQEVGYRNILHLTIGKMRGRYGDRIPFFSVQSGTVIINSAINGLPDGGPTHVPHTIALNSWQTVEVSQQIVEDKLMFRLLIDGVELHSEENKQPQEFDCVKVYASNPWWTNLKGSIKSLHIQTFG